MYFTYSVPNRIQWLHLAGNHSIQQLKTSADGREQSKPDRAVIFIPSGFQQKFHVAL